MIKYYEYKDGDNKIEFFNSVIGCEKVFVNGEVKNSKLSITGANHSFNIQSEKYQLIIDYKLFKNRSYKVNLFKNGNLIDTKTAETHPKHRLYWMAAGLFIFIFFYNRF